MDGSLMPYNPYLQAPPMGGPYGAPPPQPGQLGTPYAQQANPMGEARTLLYNVANHLRASGQSNAQIMNTLGEIAQHMRTQASGLPLGRRDVVLQRIADTVIHHEVRQSLMPNDIDAITPSPSPTTVFMAGNTVTLTTLNLQAGSAIFRFVPSDADVPNFMLRSLQIGTWNAQLTQPAPLDTLDKRLDDMLKPIVARIFTTSVPISATYLCTQDNSRAKGLGILLFNPGKTCNLDPMSRPDDRYVGTNTITTEGNIFVRILRASVTEVLSRQPLTPSTSGIHVSGLPQQPWQPPILT